MNLSRRHLGDRPRILNVAFLVAIFLASLSAADVSPMPSGDGGAAVFVCGPHAVYLILRAYGKAVNGLTLSDLEHSAPSGMSLLDVRDALIARGLQSDVRVLTVDDLVHMDRPAIIYSEQSGAFGHFWVVLRVIARAATLIDPSTGQRYVEPVDRLPRMWGGYAVIPQPLSRWRYDALAVPAALGLSMTIFALAFWRTALRRTGIILCRFLRP